jgi:CRP-like cAMP-binding protein
MYREVLIDSGFFARLNDESIDSIMTASKPEVCEFSRKEILWREGDVIDGIGVVLNGTLLCQRFQPDGRAQLLRLFEPSHLMSLEAAVSQKRTSPVSIVANTAGSYLWFSHNSLFANAAIPSEVVRTLYENLLFCLADDSIRFMNKTDVLARRTVRGRIFLFLSFLRRRQGDCVDVGMSQEEFAQYLCVDRSSLSMELNKMRRDGLIEFEGTQYLLHFPKQLKSILKGK